MSIEFCGDMDSTLDLVDRMSGHLLGVALGDALGLPFEGSSLARVSRRAGALDRFRLFFRTGFVSDDTEQSALVAEVLCGHQSLDACVSGFRSAMRLWFARLPFGIGGATLRACLRLCFGLKRSGIKSAGNGAAMRAGVIGCFFASDPAQRLLFGRALASVTHTDQRAIEGALFVAEVSAAAIFARIGCDRFELVRDATYVLEHQEMTEAVSLALELAHSDAELSMVVERLGNSGFIVHTVGLATYCFVKHGGSSMGAIQAAIRCGGDTDSIAAIVGGWVGTLHGESSLPPTLIAGLHNGPFGPKHLRGLAQAMVDGSDAPRWSQLGALIRNLFLYPVVIAHGVLRIVLR